MAKCQAGYEIPLDGSACQKCGATENERCREAVRREIEAQEIMRKSRETVLYDRLCETSERDDKRTHGGEIVRLATI